MGKKPPAKEQAAPEINLRDMQAVILAENFSCGSTSESPDEELSPLSLSTALSLPSAEPVRLLAYSIELLYSLKIREAFVVCRKESQPNVESFLKSAGYHKHVKVVVVPPLTETVCDALRAIGGTMTSPVTKDFLLLWGSALYTASESVSCIAKHHLTRRLKDKTHLLTSMFLEDSPSYASVALDESCVLGIGYTDDGCSYGKVGEVLHWSSHADGAASKSLALNLSADLLTWAFKMDRLGNLRFYNNARFGFVSAFSPDIFTLLSEQADYQNFREDIIQRTIDAKFDDGISPYSIDALVHKPKEGEVCSILVESTRLALNAIRPVISQPECLPTQPAFRNRERNVLASETIAAAYPGLLASCGEYVSISAGCVFEDAQEVRLNDCILGRNCKVGRGVALKNVILGEGCVIADGVSLKNVVVPPGEKVSSSREDELRSLPRPDIENLWKRWDERCLEESESEADQSEGDDERLEDFRAEVVGFLQEGLELNQSMEHIARQLRIFRTTQQIDLLDLLKSCLRGMAVLAKDPLSLASSVAAKQKAASEHYVRFTSLVEELHLDTLDEHDWIEALNDLVESGETPMEDLWLHFWGLFHHDLVSAEQFLGWWACVNEESLYADLQEQRAMIKLMTHIQEVGDESSDSCSGSDSD